MEGLDDILLEARWRWVSEKEYTAGRDIISLLTFNIHLTSLTCIRLLQQPHRISLLAYRRIGHRNVHT